MSLRPHLGGHSRAALAGDGTGNLLTHHHSGHFVYRPKSTTSLRGLAEVAGRYRRWATLSHASLDGRGAACRNQTGVQLHSTQQKHDRIFRCLATCALRRGLSLGNATCACSSRTDCHILKPRGREYTWEFAMGKRGLPGAWRIVNREKKLAGFTRVSFGLPDLSPRQGALLTWLNCGPKAPCQATARGHELVAGALTARACQRSTQLHVSSTAGTHRHASMCLSPQRPQCRASMCLSHRCVFL